MESSSETRRQEEGGGYWCQSLSLIYDKMAKYFIPTSPQLLFHSQKNLLDRFVKVKIQNKIFNLKNGEYLNYIDINKEIDQPEKQTDVVKNKTQNTKPTLILMHGFGSGLGMFFDNYDLFAQRFDRVIAVDWLGMGGSSRPRCTGAPRLPIFNGWCSEEPMNPTKATDFFIDSLEEFRKENQIDNFVLAGHSLGGYLSARYVMKYPHQGLKALVLISPAGLADHPPLEHQVPSTELSTAVRLLDVMWSNNFTPQQIVRFLGPKGPATVKNVVSRRFGANRWNESDSALIADYLYHITAAPASGEYAMNSILRPIIAKGISVDESQKEFPKQGSKRVEKKLRETDYSTAIYAREPISPKLFHKAITTNSPNSSSTIPPPPVLLLYGDHDWLRFPNMEGYINDLRSYQIKADLITIPSAGHHLYMDNAVVFHQNINQWLDSVNVK